MPKLFEWCSKVGIYYDAIHLQEIPGAGYGVVAAKDLPRNFIISKVPCSAMLSANEIKNSTIGNLIPTSMAESYTVKNIIFQIFVKFNAFQLPLALKLIFETFEPTEAWSPYIEFLPRALFHPLLFEPKDFIYLEGSRTYRVLTDVYFTNMIQYVQFYLHMLEQPHFCKTHDFNLWITNLILSKVYNTPINWETLTFRLFMWATVNIQSRVLETDSCTGIIDEVMVPLYDMTNHDFDKNLDCFTDKS